MYSPETKTLDVLNPKIQEIQIGKRELRTIKIYPLSVKDQTDLSDLITEALQAFFAQRDESDMAFVKALCDIVTNNVSRVLEMVTDIPEEGGINVLLSEITNEQALALGEVIYQANYEALVKKVKDLSKSGMIKNIGQALERSSQESSDHTPSTD